LHAVCLTLGGGKLSFAKTCCVAIVVATLGSACSKSETATDPLQSILAADIQRSVDRLTAEDFSGRGAGTEGERLAGVYLAGLFEEYGLQGGGWDGSYYQDFSIFEGYSRNVLAMLTGSDPQLKDEWIIIGAHYDHLGKEKGRELEPSKSLGYYPGADDDASGTSVMLEVAQALAMAKTAPARSILFMAFGSEERGLLGSKHYIANPVKPLEKTVAMVNLEMMGRGDVDALTVMLLEEMPAALSNAAKGAANEMGFTLVDGRNAHLGAGDQYPFYKAGVPILCFYGGENHPDYHRMTDTADKIQSEWMQSVGRLVYLALIAMANAPSIN